MTRLISWRSLTSCRNRFSAYSGNAQSLRGCSADLTWEVGTSAAMSPAKFRMTRFLQLTSAVSYQGGEHHRRGVS